ncbi:MAG: peptide deformylase [Ignavibacteria bacterium]|nr:peptide deformylase [Ignavibacteria bacterium]MBI3765410.1 peptide deformylase [Ignavibacteriales bacterium]
MAIGEILLLGNPVLRVKCEKVRNFADPEVDRTIQDLRDTLNNFRISRGFGRGIVAPQIGVGKRVIFINMDEPVAIINPEITKRSRQLMTMWDDCFSFPDIMVKVKRHAKITVTYYDENGKKQHLEAVGGLSELLQHEIDHINGVLAVDRAIDSKHIILRSEWAKISGASKSVHVL